MQIAERNRRIKSLLTKCFGAGKVSVRGSRGTAYGWVSVNIDYAPLTPDHRAEIVSLIWKMFERDNIQIGTYGYDSPGSDYGYGREIHFNFQPCRYQTNWEASIAKTDSAAGMIQ